MDFMEISKKRVTVRQFDQTPVEDEKIHKILEAGRWFPTAVNAQPQRILVLFIAYDKTACWTHPQSGENSGATDATIVATHMMLEAASIDLGTVWISYFDKTKARELLQLPDNWQPVCMLYIGYPTENFRPNPHLSGYRKPLSATCFFNEVPSE